MSKLRLSIGLCLLLTLVGTAPAVWAEEVHHAPSVEQWRADQRLWLSTLENPTGTGGDNVRFEELQGWFLEEVECQTVDPHFQVQYYNTAAEITALEMMRLKHFAGRRNLYDQFLTEDAQGKR
jgi:hypothetical protein